MFRRPHRAPTPIRGGVLLVTALLGLLALRVGSGADWLHWVMAIAMLVGAVRFTKGYPAHVRAQARAQARGRPLGRGDARIPGKGPRTLG